MELKACGCAMYNFFLFYSSLLRVFCKNSLASGVDMLEVPLLEEGQEQFTW
jgi:hypothetical protein